MSYLNPSVPPASKYRKSGSSHLASSGFGVSSLADYAQTDPRLFEASSFSNTSPTEFGLQANKSIPYHFSATTNDISKLSPGALMFAFRTARIFGIKPPEHSRYVEDLIGLNKWLQDNSDHKDLSSIEQVMDQITFMGVLKSQITNNLRERNGVTFVMNCIVGQRASVVNVWGPDAREGTPLYFIVKKVQKGSKAKPVWQFVPYASLKRPCPPISALMSDDFKDLGQTIFVGTAMSTPTAYAEGNENILDSPNAGRLACYAGGVDVCVGV